MTSSAPAKRKILNHIVGLFDELPRSVIVGLSGLECAGKSTLAAELQEALEAMGYKSMAISIDDFLNPTEIRHDGADLAECYYEKTFRRDD